MIMPHLIFTPTIRNISVVILIDTLEVRDGRLPRRAMAMVLEWAALHRQELLTDWALAAEHKPLRQIDPLE